MEAAVVRAEPAGPGFAAAPGQQVFFDGTAGCLHVVEGRMISSVPLPPATAAAGAGDAAGSGAATLHDGDEEGGLGRAYLVSEGPPVTFIAAAADGSITALQRSPRVIEFTDHMTGNMWVETPTGERGRGGGWLGQPAPELAILGFFWATAPGCEFVIVTTLGLETHCLQPSRQGMRAGAVHRVVDARWWRYDHPSGIALVGSGLGGGKVHAFQFSRAGLLRLPLLDLNPPWSSSPIKARSPAQAAVASPGGGSGRGRSPAPAPPAPLRSAIGAEVVWVVTLYHRVYCALHDREAGQLRLYRLYRDASALQHEFDAPSEAVHLSVVDSVLLVHSAASGAVQLIDIRDPHWTLGRPLPLALPGRSGAAAAASPAQQLPVSTQAGLSVGSGGGLSVAVAPPPAPPEAHEATEVQLFPPCWALDAAGGTVYLLILDLQAAVQAACHLRAGADWGPLIAFLQRRCPSRDPARDPHAITCGLLRRLLEWGETLSSLRRAFDSATQAAVGAGRRTSGAGAGPSEPPLPAVTTLDMLLLAFGPLAAEPPAPDHPALGQGGSSSDARWAMYLGGAVCEWVASAAARGTPPAPELAAFWLDLLTRQGRGHQVRPLLRTLRGLLDSPGLAEHLRARHEEGLLPEGEALALEMLRRLHAHEACARALLQRGRVREALELARRHGVVEVPTVAYLSAAAEAGDPLLAAAVRRVCGGSGPGQAL